MRVNARVFLYLGQMFELVHCYIENTRSNIQTVAKSTIAPKDNVMKDHHEEDDLNKNSGVIVNIDNKEYKPDWADLDTRLLPEWYDKAKIGILVHWGAFHMPSFQSKWFWHDWRQGGMDENCEKFVKYNYPQAFTYQDIPIFQAEFFEPKRIAKMFAMSGAKYVVLTSKHHDGFALYPSKRSQKWNSVDIGPRRDLVGDFARAIKKLDLKFGVYYSLYEWLNPLYLSDQEANFTTNIFPTHKIFPEIKQLVTDYQPSVLWSDGDWQAPDSYWNSTGILAWLYNESPVKEEIVVNDRWGQGIRCQHGDFFDCADKYKPGELPQHKWENVFTLDKESWSYNKKMSFFDVLTIRQLLYEVITTVSCGGNVLINIGITSEGTIVPIFEERLTSLGEWIKINGEAIYATSPWLYQNDTFNGGVWYTCTKVHYNVKYPTAKPKIPDTVTAVYAMFMEWPVDNILFLTSITILLENQWRIELLGNEGNILIWKTLNRTAGILLPRLETVKSKYAWTIRFLPTIDTF